MELLQLSAAVLIIVLVFGLFMNLNKKENEIN
jgi:hypothetical protein